MDSRLRGNDIKRAGMTDGYDEIVALFQKFVMTDTKNPLIPLFIRDTAVL